MILYDMVDLNDYLKLNSNAIVDLVNKKYVPAEMTKEPTFEELATLLMGRFVHQYGSEEEVGKRNQAHNVLAMAIISIRQRGGSGKKKSSSQRSCNGDNIFNLVRMVFPRKSK